MEEDWSSEELILIFGPFSRKQNPWRELSSLSSSISMPDLSGTIVGSSWIAQKEKSLVTYSPPFFLPPRCLLSLGWLPECVMVGKALHKYLLSANVGFPLLHFSSLYVAGLLWFWYGNSDFHSCVEGWPLPKGRLEKPFWGRHSCSSVSTAASGNLGCQGNLGIYWEIKDRDFYLLSISPFGDGIERC